MIEINDGLTRGGIFWPHIGEHKMLIYEYLDDEPQRAEPRRIIPDVVSIDDSFKRKLFPVRPLPYVLVISLLLLVLFAANEERFEALVHASAPVATATTAEPTARLSLPARAAIYRENSIAR